MDFAQPSATERFIRFQSSAPNRRGRFPGVFALVNGLSRDGCLAPAQEEYRRCMNAWYNANLADPGRVDPSVYDRTRHPGATAWFKSSATDLIAPVADYLSILDAHHVGWIRLETDAPGDIIYDDPHQIVVMPFDSR
ncbi:hypothetical protein [Nocardia asiatica]|uniref:hypothetical protein n=1 Tax=Nocardia asiatica TaxID=209252 RepID=UPI002457F558|nr:hypothetical protein [Nocardia asiatica]